MYQELKETWDELTGPDGAFEVTQVEVRGVNLRAYKNAPTSLREVWLSSAAFAENDYLVYQDERWTYAEAHRDVASIASWLADNGVGSGDRVAIAMRNYPEWLLSYWAVVSMGATVVGMNAWWVEQEMAFGIEDSEPKVMICDAERLERLIHQQDHFSRMKIVTVRCDSPPGTIPWSDLLAHGGTMPEAVVDPDSDACIFYTSGTTGHPKGAQLTHRGCVNNIMNMAFWGAASTAALVKAGRQEAPDPDAVTPTLSALVTTPLFHVTANNCLAHATTLSGGKLVHMYRWDAGEALKMIEREKITNLTGVPVMSRELITHPDFDKFDTSTLTGVGGGGAQLQPDLVQKIDDTVKTARPSTGYGMTETCGIITSVGGDYFIDRPDSAGPAMPTFEVRVVDDEGVPLPSGSVGELCVKGAPVIKGYLNRPEATAESIVEGWLFTGDVARVDENGFIFIVDRKKDMVLRGGENVYCAEVETAIFDHHNVAECTVFGVPDDRLGEEVGAAVFLKEGASVDSMELREHCEKLIAKHKIPRYFWFMDEALPRNASGKFLKRELRDTLKVTEAS